MAPKRIIGVDLQQDSVRVVVLTRRKDGMHLAGQACVALPKGEPELLPTVLRKACLAAGVSSGPAALALPRGEVAARTVLLPPAPPDQVEPMLDMEVQQYSPFPSPESAFGYLAQPPRPETGEVECLLVVARQAALDSARRTLASAGLSPAWLAAQGVALCGMLTGERPVLVIQVEAGWTGLDLVSGGLSISRTLPLGSARLREAGQDPSVLERLAGEVERCLLSAGELPAPPELVLVGGGAQEALAALLAERLGVACRLWTASGQPGLAAPTPLGPEYALAAAVALQAATGPATLALRTHAPETERRSRSRAVLVGALSLLAVVVVVLVALGRGPDPEQVARTQRLLVRVNSLQARADHLADLERELRVRVREQRSFPDAARDFAVRAPAGVWLSSFACGPGGRATARGKALSSAKVGQLMTALGESPCFTDLNLAFVRQTKVGESALVEFSITWEPPGE